MAHIDTHRAIHAAAAPLFDLAGEGGQGDRLDDALPAFAVAEQIEVFELFGECHGGLSLIQSGGGRDALGEVGQVGVGDALLETEVFQRRYRRVVVVDAQLAALEGGLGVELFV